MSAPFLSNPKSGFGGRGYTAIFEPEKTVVPSVTTVLGALDKPGITQWAVDQTAAYAAANPEYLLNRSVEQAFAGLRWYHKRTPDWDDSTVDIHNYHTGVLNDLAQLGTNIHEWAEAFFQNDFEPDLTRQENVDMAEQLILWFEDNDVEVLYTEATVFGNGYAGTLDLIARVNGVLRLIDLKTSRAIRDEHMGQLGALGAAHTMAVEVPEGTEGAVSHTLQVECDALDEGAKKKTKTLKGEKVEYWSKDWTKWFVAEPLPPIQGYGVLQLRPDDVDNKGNFVPAFCAFHEIPNEVIEPAFELFRGALAVRVAQRDLKEAKKGWMEEDD